MTITRRGCLHRAAAALLGTAPRLACAQPPAIVLGHTYPATGIFADTAAEMKAAIDAAVAMANAGGGIAGRRLSVVSMDDGYDAQRSVANAERLRSEHGAVALVAPVGAPNLAALMPWAAREHVPLIGARSGADGQRQYHRYTFFVIASFGDEVRHVARHLATIGLRRVAVASMANPTGQDIAARFVAAAQSHHLSVVTSQSFDPAGRDAASSASALIEARPQALLLAGGGHGAIELAGRLLDAGMPASAIYALSLLQPLHVHRLVGDRANGMVFAQVTPRLDDSRLRLTAQYRGALKALPGSPDPTPFGLEGFLAAQVALRGLASAGSDPTGASLTTAIERLGKFDLGGLPLQYDGTSHHGTRYVDLGILMRGRVTR